MNNISNFYINIGNNKYINADKISFLFTVEEFQKIKESLNIQYIFKEENYEKKSYVVIKEFGNYYAYECLHTIERIKNKINDIYKGEKI